MHEGPKIDGKLEKSKKKILIIDNDSDFTKGCRKGLNSYDFDGISVSVINCQSATDALKEIDLASPILVFFDHNLSQKGGEGFEIAKMLTEKNIEGISISDTPSIVKSYQGNFRHVNKSFNSILIEIMKTEESILYPLGHA